MNHNLSFSVSCVEKAQCHRRRSGFQGLRALVVHSGSHTSVALNRRIFGVENPKRKEEQRRKVGDRGLLKKRPSYWWTGSGKHCAERQIRPTLMRQRIWSS
jgi:hypothetical protein